jgi:hypothetical protein
MDGLLQSSTRRYALIITLDACREKWLAQWLLHRSTQNSMVMDEKE